jgi:hypothetical protein
MRVNHGGAHVGVTQQLLYRTNVGARLQQMRGKAVSLIPPAELTPYYIQHGIVSGSFACVGAKGLTIV